MDSRSITHWFRKFGQGDEQAAARLWERYGDALARLAKSRYPAALNPATSEEDLAQSVFLVLWRGAAQGRWDEVQNRTELWWVLLEITRRKALGRLARQNADKRKGLLPGQGNTIEGSDESTIAIPDHRELTPEAILLLKEEQERLMGLLRDDVLRTIAGWKLEGLSHEEIAERLDISQRTVIRKLNLIREHWSQELAP